MGQKVNDSWGFAEKGEPAAPRVRATGEASTAPCPSLIPEREASLAHFRNLFIAQDRWGSGLATTLHAASVKEARRRGFAQMRLFTPAFHRRARRFYEREGWTARGEPFAEPRLGMALVQYRYALA